MKTEMSIRTISQKDETNPLRHRPKRGEFLIRGFLFFCGAFSILTTLGIVYELGKESLLFFRNPAVNLFDFFTGTKWQPQAGAFGILPLVTATLITTAIACALHYHLGWR
jgi:phosphate transport system permease protein